MEQTVVKILEGYEIDAEDYPEIVIIIRDQIKQTRKQSIVVRSEIERLGGQIVESESMELIDLTSPFQYTAGNIDRDRVVKNAMTQHAFEHFNHAAYTALIKAAEFYNEPQTITICHKIMAEDKEMAQTIQSKLSGLVERFLGKQAN
jgi:ferritin-like metal-binding protein YciE